MPLRGDVVRVNLDPTIGSEITKLRPCVVVQRDAANRTSPTTIVVPLTDARGDRGNILHVFVPRGTGGTSKDSVAACNQIRTIDTRRITGPVLGTLPLDRMQAIDASLRRILDL
jgi:mRNA interferase MazF